jgi:hypothetical protein
MRRQVASVQRASVNATATSVRECQPDTCADDVLFPFTLAFLWGQI